MDINAYFKDIQNRPQLQTKKHYWRPKLSEQKKKYRRLSKLIQQHI